MPQSYQMAPLVRMHGVVGVDRNRTGGMRWVPRRHLSTARAFRDKEREERLAP